MHRHRQTCTDTDRQTRAQRDRHGQTVLTRMHTLVRLLASVCANVLLQVAQLGEFALTDLTLVGFESRVDACMLREIGRVGKALGACRAFVRLGILLVDLLAVDQHVRLGREHLGARESTYSTVATSVCAHAVTTSECVHAMAESVCVHAKATPLCVHAVATSICVHAVATSVCVHLMATLVCVQARATSTSDHTIDTSLCRNTMATHSH